MSAEDTREGEGYVATFDFHPVLSIEDSEKDKGMCSHFPHFWAARVQWLLVILTLVLSTSDPRALTGYIFVWHKFGILVIFYSSGRHA